MKRSLLSIFAFAALASCDNTNTSEYAILRGKTPTGNELVRFMDGMKITKEVTSDANGNFADTIHNIGDGVYAGVIVGNQNAITYLEKGDDVSFNFEDGLKVEGKGIEKYNFQTVKSEELRNLFSNPTEFFSQTPEALFKTISDKINSLKEKLSQTKASKEFQSLEERALDYWMFYQLNRYVGVAKRQGKEVVIPKEMQEIIDGINYDNDKDYQKIPLYNQIVNDYYSQKMYTLETEGDLTNFFNSLKDIKAESIKNGLYERLANMVSLENPFKDAIYKEITSREEVSKEAKEIAEKNYEVLKNLAEGAPSPTFEYENYNGGTTKLEDLKGKFVYIDVWATWCAPCRAEIPYLKELEKYFHGKDIEFVSISIDEKKDYEKWRTFVKDEELKGIQLYADNAWKSQFISDYLIKGIPRFILLDREGKIISPNASRPSDPATKELMENLLKK